MADPILPVDPRVLTVHRCDYEYPLVMSRLHRVPDSGVWRLWLLGVVFGIGFFIYLICFILFLFRMKRDPLKERSPYLLLFSALGGAVVLGYMYSRQFFDLVLICPITYYVVELSLMVFFLPYILRSYRAICVWKKNLQGSTAMRSDDDDDDDGNAKKARNASSKEDKTKSSKTKVSWLNKYKLWYQEKTLFIIMFIFCVVWLFIGIAVHLILMFSAFIWHPSCQKKCNAEEGWALRVFVFIIAIMVIPYMVLVFLMRKMDDVYSIRNELLILCLVSIVLIVIMIVLAVVPNAFWPEQPYIGYVLSLELVLSFVISVVWPLFSTFTTQYNIDVVYLIRSKLNPDSFKLQNEDSEKKSEIPLEATTATTADPVNEAQISDTVKTDDTGNVIKETNTNVDVKTAAKGSNTEFEYFLSNKSAKECFKQFLVREFSVENLMFFTEVRYFKKCDDLEMKDVAENIITTYVSNGAPFEINIPSAYRTELEGVDLESGMNRSIFDKAENVIYQMMLTESFPRFKRSKLYQNFNKESSKDKKKKKAKP